MSPRSFRAMGVDVVVGGSGADSWRAVRALVLEWDEVFSRFRDASELNRVNAACTETVLVSETFARAVRAALAAARATDGLVDPTLGAALLAAGYERDFPAVGDDSRPSGPACAGSWTSVRLAGRVLSRPPGTLLDLNGVVKGLVVDEALRLLPESSYVSAGGDLATGRELVVGLPGGGSVRLGPGGLATSGITRRRWIRGGVEQHHLVDPRTGRPARSRWDEVTVAASSCLEADVAAKAAFLLSDDGPGWLDEVGLPGRFLAGVTATTNDAWRHALSTPKAAA